MPTGFDALPVIAGQLVHKMAADSNSRVFISSGGVGANSEKIRFIDDTAATFTDANPSTDSIFVSGIIGLSTGKDGAVWAGPLGTTLIRRAVGATAWVGMNTGLPTSASQYMTAPGFDAAGNGYVALTASNAVQMYKLPVGGTTWATHGPSVPTTQARMTPVFLADGTGYFSNLGIGGNKIYSLDPAATAYTVAYNLAIGELVLGNDGTVYGLVGAGSGTKVISKAPGATMFTDAQALGMSGSGITNPGGICVHPSGDVYASTTPLNATVSGLWRRSAATGTWEQLVLNPIPTGAAGTLACAPNGRIYSIWANRVYRSKP